MWERSRHRTERPSFGEEVGGRAAGKLGLLYWLFYFGWVACRSIAYGFSLLVSTTPGRVIGGLAVVATSLYAWQITAAAGCLTAAVVVAPQFFSAVARHAYIPDEVSYPEESRTVETRDSREIERGERMTDGRDHSENRTPEEQRNGEAKFASPEENSVGIGYYDEQGNPLSPEEFASLVARDARLREEEDDR